MKSACVGVLSIIELKMHGETLKLLTFGKLSPVQAVNISVNIRQHICVAEGCIIFGSVMGHPVVPARNRGIPVQLGPAI